MSSDQIHDALHEVLIALSKDNSPKGLALRKVIHDLQVVVLSDDERLPVVAMLSVNGYTALVDWTSQIMNDVTEMDAAGYLVEDELGSDLGYDIVPSMGPKFRF